MKKQKTFFHLSIFAAVLIFVGFQSCVKDDVFKQDFRIDTDPQFAVPLINATMHIGTANFIEKLGWGDSSSNFYIDYDEDGMMKFHYTIEQEIDIPAEASYIPLDPIGEPISGSVALPFFKDIEDIKFNIEKIHLNLIVENESANELILSKNALYLSNGKDGKTRDIPMGAPFNIQTGPSTQTLPLSIDSVNFPPDSLRYNFTLKSNANSIKGGKMKIKAEVIFDLFGYFDDIRLGDTVAFTLGDNSSLDSLPAWIKFNSAILRTTFTNNFPLAANVQLYFMDKNYRIVDSLFKDTKVLAEATIDPVTYQVVKSGTMPPQDIVIDEDRYDILSKAEYVWIVSNFRSANASTPKHNVKIFKTNNLNVKMGLKTSVGFHGTPE